MAPDEHRVELEKRIRIQIHGAVQGVGFRPFVFKLAREMRLNGWVLNSNQGVFVEVEGVSSDLDRFVRRLEKEKPSRAYIQGIKVTYLDFIGFRDFIIRESDVSGLKSAFVLPDIAICSECAEEIFDPENRRYLYPFTNCTNCGPRFSIIKSLPYDRPNTTMDSFQMCGDCRREYNDPTDRRFHAQPNACPKCGPHIELWDSNGRVVATRADALLQAAEAIRGGKILALKGIGGFQLLVDAGDDIAVRRLRERKHREEKPFALMFPTLEEIKGTCDVSGLEERFLVSPEAPIVLLRKKKLEIRSHRQENLAREALPRLAESLAARNPYLGVMVPYSPLHLILMRELGFPVVATSGNLSDEPICTDENNALLRLGPVADFFLVHNRPIERSVDDSVVRMMMDRVQVIRRARGYAPFPVELDIGKTEQEKERRVLAVGGHLKNTIAINSGLNIVISQHIGDLSAADAYLAFQKATNDFKRLYEVSPGTVTHDLHPDYLSTQFALKSGLEVLGVQHHFAHVASCMAENQLDERVLGVSWDGAGYGEDGTIWGSEFLITDGSSYHRVATFRSFRLPGGDASVKEPRRTALGLLFEVFGGKTIEMHNIPTIQGFDSKMLSILRKMLESRINAPFTTSAGRLFDAVSSIVGIRQVVNFEGQAAMELEFAADCVRTEETYNFEIVKVGASETRERRTGDGEGITDCGESKHYDPDFIIDWAPMVRGVLTDRSKDVAASLISAKFHNTLARFIVDIARRVNIEKVVLSGGCFQNKYLTESVIKRLSEEGFRPYWHQRVPTNDGGISLGQMYVALMKRRKSEIRSQMPENRSEEPGAGSENDQHQERQLIIDE